MRPSHREVILPHPSLLISPMGSFTRAGPFAPTLNADASVIAGDYQPLVYHMVAPNPNTNGSLAVSTPGSPFDDHRNPNGPITCATRMRIFAGNNSTSYGITSAGSSPNRFYLGMQQTGIPIFVAGSVTINGAYALSLDDWHILVGVMNAGVATLYADGVPVATGLYTGTNVGSAAPAAVIIGTPTVFDFAASMIFPCALTPQQVRALRHRIVWTWGME